MALINSILFKKIYLALVIAFGGGVVVIVSIALYVQSLSTLHYLGHPDFGQREILKEIFLISCLVIYSGYVYKIIKALKQISKPSPNLEVVEKLGMYHVLIVLFTLSILGLGVFLPENY